MKYKFNFKGRILASNSAEEIITMMKNIENKNQFKNNEDYMSYIVHRKFINSFPTNEKDFLEILVNTNYIKVIPKKHPFWDYIYTE